MNWSTVKELVKINILYSNPQAVTAVKRKQEKNPQKRLSTYKSVIRQQVVLSLFFAVIYIFMFASLNFKHYPGYFSFYTAIFFIMASLNAFSAMYSIFYESDDVKLQQNDSQQDFVKELIDSGKLNKENLETVTYTLNEENDDYYIVDVKK